MPHLSNHLSAARRRRFIGRTAEQTLFESALTAPELPFFLLYVYGPGGVGKTSLLGRFAGLAEQAGVMALSIDARNFEPTPEAFQASLCLMLGVAPGHAPAEVLASQPKRAVLLIDTCELLSPLDDWLRNAFLPELPSSVLTVVASRYPPALAWRADPGWQPFLRVLPLHNLTPAEGRAYLAQRNVPADDLQTVLDFTHSFPLALSLVADLYDQRPGFHFKPLEAPDVLKLLLEQFLQRAPGPAHRAALEACALVRVITEGLLAELLTVPDAHDLFEWLRGLTFVEAQPGGLAPHDLAREVLAADLRWRNPSWYAELHRRARVFYTRLLQKTNGPEQQLALFDFVYLHRANPAVRPFFEWQTSGSTVPDRLRDHDAETLIAMVERHEGVASAALARYWLTRQPENFIVFRDSAGQAAGFMALLAVERATANDLANDPAIDAAWSFLQRNGSLHAGERATYFRFWLAADAYQDVSPIQSVIFINMVRHYFTRGLAYTFYACAFPDFWAPVFTYADLARLPELDFEVGGRRFGVYGHDWRAAPPLAWLDLLGQREIAASPESVQPPVPTGRLMAFSQESFTEAVHDALRNYVRPDVLHANPLLHARVVSQRAGAKAAETARVSALRTLLKEAAEQLRASPKENKYYRAVYHTYIQPAATQEQAAELLDAPFSSYRRHLKIGMARIAEIMWRAETGETEE